MKYWVVLVSKLVFFKEFFKFTVQLLYFLATLSYIYIIFDIRHGYANANVRNLLTGFSSQKENNSRLFNIFLPQYPSISSAK